MRVGVLPEGRMLPRSADRGMCIFPQPLQIFGACVWVIAVRARACIHVRMRMRILIYAPPVRATCEYMSARMCACALNGSIQVCLCENMRVSRSVSEHMHAFQAVQCLLRCHTHGPLA